MLTYTKDKSLTMADKYLEQIIGQFGNSGDLASLLKIQDFHHRKYYDQLFSITHSHLKIMASIDCGIATIPR